MEKMKPFKRLLSLFIPRLSPFAPYQWTASDCPLYPLTQLTTLPCWQRILSIIPEVSVIFIPGNFPYLRQALVRYPNVWEAVTVDGSNLQPVLTGTGFH